MPMLGPVQNRRQLQIVSDFVDEARRKGGRVFIGGEPSEGPGYFYPVTLVADVDHGCRLVDEEQFGPALPIIRYHDVDEAVAKANATSMGLGGSVWGSDLEGAKRVGERIEAGLCLDQQARRHSAECSLRRREAVRASASSSEWTALKEFTTVQTVFC